LIGNAQAEVAQGRRNHRAGMIAHQQKAAHSDFSTIFPNRMRV
jgi:hypothetical protein